MTCQSQSFRVYPLHIPQVLPSISGGISPSHHVATSSLVRIFGRVVPGGTHPILVLVTQDQSEGVICRSSPSDPTSHTGNGKMGVVHT